MEGKKLLHHLTDHLGKSAQHHATCSALHEKLHKSHSAIADAVEDPTVGACHRDLAGHHKKLAAAHTERQQDFQALREELAAGSGADVLDSHEDETRDMQNVLLARGFLSQDELILKTVIRR